MLEGDLECEVNLPGNQSRLARLLETVESGKAVRAPTTQLVDRIAGWFVLAILLAAAATAIYWWWQGSRPAAERLPRT